MNQTQEESGWVIERYLNGELTYWDGRKLDDSGFRNDHALACRFARREDAAVVLAWLLHGHGNPAQHLWVSPPFGADNTHVKAPPQQPFTTDEEAMDRLVSVLGVSAPKLDAK